MIPHSKIVTIVVIRMSKLQVIAIMDFDYSRFNLRTPTLAAISAGSVFMGANSYIGNAPNFMVKAIAEDRGVRMPSFFGYVVWAAVVLLPLFIVMTLIWFR